MEYKFNAMPNAKSDCRVCKSRKAEHAAYGWVLAYDSNNMPRKSFLSMPVCQECRDTMEQSGETLSYFFYVSRGIIVRAEQDMLRLRERREQKGLAIHENAKVEV